MMLGKLSSWTMVVSLVGLLGGCGGNVSVEPAGGGDGGEGGGVSTTTTTNTGGNNTGGNNTGGNNTGGSSEGGSTGTGTGPATCAELGELACLNAYPSCVPVYDDQCCPSCNPNAGCADCSNIVFHHCAPKTPTCAPGACGFVPDWACAGGEADCSDVVPWTSKIPCATKAGCIAAYCPVDVDCTTDPVCVPIHADICWPNCFSTPPDCPPDTIPAAHDGCWTGYCVSADHCPIP